MTALFRRFGSEPSRQKILDLGLMALGFAAVGGALLTLTGRTGGDQEVFMYAAARLLAGARPGLDLWEVKPPVHIYFLALGQWLWGGPSYFSTLAIDLVLQFTGAAILAIGLARRLSARLGALVGLLYLADYYLVIPYWTRAQVEATANALMMAALGLLLTNSLPLWFVAGLLFATAGLTKGITLLFLLPFGVLVLAEDRRARWRKLFGFSAGVGAGLAAWFALWALSGSLAGVLTDFRDVTVFESHGSLNLLWALVSSMGYALTTVTWPTLLGVMLLPFIDWRAARRGRSRLVMQLALFLAAWVVVAISMVALQNNFFNYHYLHLVVAGALLAGLAVYLVAHYPSPLTRLRFSVAIGLLVCLVGAAIAGPDFRDDFRRNALLADTARQVDWLSQTVIGKLSRQDYMQRLALRSTYDEDELLSTAAAVRADSCPGDQVLYLDSGKIAWRVNRVSASRYFLPLPVQRVLSGRSPQTAATQAYRDLYAEIWNYAGPVIVLEEGWFQLANDPALQARVMSRYTVAVHNPSPTPFGGHDVLVPKTPPAGQCGGQK